MINVPGGVQEPTRREFDRWVIDSYENLRARMFDTVDGIRKLKRERLLSADMFCYLIIKDWHKQVMRLEDIRTQVDWDAYATIESYLESDEWEMSEDDRRQLEIDTQLELLGWFIPEDGQPKSDMGRNLYELINAMAMLYRIVSMQGMGCSPTKIMGALAEWVDTEQDADALRDSYYDVMGLMDLARANHEKMERLADVPQVVQIYRLLELGESNTRESWEG